MKKVMISKDQIRLHNPNKENNASANPRAEIQKFSIKAVKQPSIERSQAQVPPPATDVTPPAAQVAKPMKIKMGQIAFTQSFIE